MLADYNVALAWAAGGTDRRWGVSRFSPNFPLGIYRCKEGYVGITVVTPVQWRTFCRMLGLDELGTDTRFVERTGRLTNADELEARFAPRFLERTAQEWFALALEQMFPLVVVPSISDLLACPEHRRREAFERIHTAIAITSNPLRHFAFRIRPHCVAALFPASRNTLPNGLRRARRQSSTAGRYPPRWQAFA